MTVAALVQGAGQAASEAAATGHASPVIAIVGLVTGLLVVAAIVDLVAKRLAIPFTVALVVAGASLAVLAERVPFLAALATVDVTPEAVFFVFLPALIFQSAFHLDARALRANLGPTLTLAVPGLLISTGLIGAVMQTAGPWVGLPLSWPEALLLGSILSATDPVAVISLFSQLGAPKRLTVLVEGESLFNDATAIVISRIILGVIAAGAFTTETLVEGVAEFAAVFFGGLLVGAILAVIAGTIIGRARRDPFLEITATTVLAYLSFYLAEHSLELSGVMAVVAAGVLIGGWGKTKVSPSVATYLEHFWDYFAGVANALIFLLVGLTVDVGALVAALPVLVWVIGAMLVSRAIVIYTLVPASSRWTGSEPVSRSYQAVMYWGGLRGGIALAIALALPESLAVKADFVTLATGAVLFTLVVQGLTIERVVRHFRLHIAPLSDQLARLEGGIAGKLNVLTELPMLEAGGLFPPRVAESVRARATSELDALREQLSDLRTRELDVELERRILFLRCFGTERTLHLEMFQKGHLTERAYRDLEHSVVAQSDAIRHMGRIPDFTLHPPTADRVVSAATRVFEKVPGLSGSVERMREGAAERDYETAWARFHGDADVLNDLERLVGTGSHRAEVVEEVASLYTYWRESARSRLDQTAELFPEFVAATQDRLAARLAVEAERSAIEAQERTGALPGGVATSLLSELGERLDELGSSRTGKLAADPNELLQKVPFFQGLPSTEFERVARHLKQKTAPRGLDIVREGDRGSSLFLVARGVVRVTHLEDGEERDVATLMAGDFFGEMALLHGGVRSATCRAVTPCALYELGRSDLDRVRESCPAIQQALEDADRTRRAELDA